MLIRSCLTLLLYTTSTVALALPAEGPRVRVAAPPPTILAAPSGATAPPRSDGAAPLAPLERDLTPSGTRGDWATEHRWLQAGTGVSWSLFGLGLIGFIVPLGMLGSCNAAGDQPGSTVDCSGERRAAGITTPIIGVLTLASLVPAILFSRRLARHSRERATARLRLSPGGLALDF